MLQQDIVVPVAPLPGRAPWPSRALDVLFLVMTVVTMLLVTFGETGTGEELSGTAALFFLTTSLWLLLGLVWTVVRVRRIRRARKGDRGWPARLAGRRLTYLITLGTAIIVLGSGANIVVLKQDEDVNSTIVRYLSIVMVVVAWTMLQLAYTERYARMQLEHTGETAHLDFPATEQPSLLEFAYFAFTVGSTFGTSDVTVQTSRMRGVVLCHGLLAFVYNTAILGMVLSLISG